MYSTLDHLDTVINFASVIKGPTRKYESGYTGQTDGHLTNSTNDTRIAPWQGCFHFFFSVAEKGRTAAIGNGRLWAGTQPWLSNGQAPDVINK